MYTPYRFFDKRLNYGTLELKDDGVYEVGVVVGGNTYLFKVTVTDEIGNTSEYSFTIEKSISVGAIIGIILGILGVVGVAVVIILKKKQIF